IQSFFSPVSLRYLNARASEKYMTPFFGDFGAFFGSQRVIFRKVFDPAEWPAGVDDGVRVGDITLAPSLRRNPRIDGAAPASTHDFNRSLRIASGSDRPQ